MSDKNIPDIDYGIDSLSETVTAAELVRSKGQHKRLKTIDKSKLKMWILQAINQARASKSGEYEDEEKEALLKETQQRLNEMMKRAQDAEKKCARVKHMTKSCTLKLNNYKRRLLMVPVSKI